MHSVSLSKNDGNVILWIVLCQSIVKSGEMKQFWENVNHQNVLRESTISERSYYWERDWNYSLKSLPKGKENGLDHFKCKFYQIFTKQVFSVLHKTQ